MGRYKSVVRTPVNSVQRRSKSKRYRQAYLSCIRSASRLALTPGLTARKFNTSRRAPKFHDISEKVKPEHLALLLKMEWKLSYVTPLYKFRHTQLKSYSRQLSAFIAAEKQHGVAVEVEGLQSGFRVSLSVMKGLTETEGGAETVLIQIHANPLFARQYETQKSVWSGWLTCINGDMDYLNSLSKDYTCLPLFGCSGSEPLSALVKSWIQQTFDCYLGPLEINDTSLQWLVALWTDCHKEYSIQQLKMIWTMPAVPPLQITYTVNLQDAWELWCSVRTGQEKDNEDEGSGIDINEVVKLMQGLKGHFFRHFRLDLSAGSLSQVTTALGSAKWNGRIKISNSRYMITTLTLLTECALLKMPI